MSSSAHLGYSSSASTIHPPFTPPPADFLGIHPPETPHPSDLLPRKHHLPIGERTINWPERIRTYQHERAYKTPFLPTTYRVAGIAFCIFATFKAYFLLERCIFAPATIVWLGMPAVATIVALFAVGIFLTTRYSYREETQGERYIREKAIEQKIKVNPKLKWNEIKAMFPKVHKPFSNQDLDCIFFQDQVESLTYHQFKAKHGIEGVAMLTEFRKEILKNKFINEIKAQKKGFNALVRCYESEMNAFSLTEQDVWNMVKTYELYTYAYRDLRSRNGEALRYLTVEEKNAIAAAEPDMRVPLL